METVPNLPAGTHQLSPKALGGTPVTIHLIVPDVDTAFDRAVGAGGIARMPDADMFWRDRYRVLEDPFGHLWSLATPQGAPLSAADLAEAAASAAS